VVTQALPCAAGLAPRPGSRRRLERARRLFRPALPGAIQLSTGLRAPPQSPAAGADLAGPTQVYWNPGQRMVESVSRHAIGRQRGEATTTSRSRAGRAVSHRAMMCSRGAAMLHRTMPTLPSLAPTTPLCRQQACRAQLRAEGIRGLGRFRGRNVVHPRPPAAGQGPEFRVLPVTSRQATITFDVPAEGRLRLTCWPAPRRPRDRPLRSRPPQLWLESTPQTVVKLQASSSATAPTRAAHCELVRFDKTTKTDHAVLRRKDRRPLEGLRR